MVIVVTGEGVIRDGIMVGVRKGLIVTVGNEKLTSGIMKSVKEGFNFKKIEGFFQLQLYISEV